MIRWKGVTFLAVLVIVIFVLSLIFTDRWLEHQLETAGSRMIGAKVEIEGLDLSLFGAKLKIDGIQVTDPAHTMRNLFQTGRCELNFEFWPLLSKKIIVENFQISDFRTNTPRKSDGALPKNLKEKQKKAGLLQKSLNKLAQNIEQNTKLPVQNVKNQANIDSVLKFLKLKSPQKIDSLQKALNQSFEQWTQRLTRTDYDKELKAIESEIRKIDPEKIKTLKGLQKALSTLKKSKTKIKLLTDSISTTKNKLQKELARLSRSVSLIQKWIEEDYKQALSRAKLPELSKSNMARMLFGATLVNRFEQYLAYLQTARTYLNKLKSAKPKKEKPPRLKGQDIYFYSQGGRPDFWIKQILLSGTTNDGLQLSGQITDLISDQRFIHRPTIIKINGQSTTNRSFALNGSLNYLQNIPHETVNFDYKGFSLNNTKISNSPYLPSKLQKGVGNLQVKVELKGDTLLCNLYFVGYELAFSPPDRQKLNDVQKLVMETLQQVTSLNIKAGIKGWAGKWQINLNSNLDDLLLAQLKKKFSAELTRAQARLRQQVEKRTEPTRQKFLAFVEQKQQWLQNQLQKHEKELKKIESELKKRQNEINKRIEKEKKKASKQVQKKLKSLFK